MADRNRPKPFQRHLPPPVKKHSRKTSSHIWRRSRTKLEDYRRVGPEIENAMQKLAEAMEGLSEKFATVSARLRELGGPMKCELCGVEVPRHSRREAIYVIKNGYVEPIWYCGVTCRLAHEAVMGVPHG